MSVTHIIKRQIFRIDIESESEFKTVSDLLMQLMKNELRSFIDQVLSTSVKQNEYIQIEQLEIDLGIIDTSNVKEEVIKAFKTLFPILVAQKISSIRATQSRKITMANREYRALLYFIAYGKPAWWQPSVASSAEHILSTYVLKKKRSGLASLWNHSTTDRLFRNRLINLLRINDLLELYLTSSKTLYLKEKASWERIINILQQHLTYIPGKGNLNLVIKENLLLYLIRSASSKVIDPIHFDPIYLLVGLSMDRLPPAAVSQIKYENRRRGLMPGKKAPFYTDEQILDRPGKALHSLPIPTLSDFKIFLERGYIPLSFKVRGYSNINELFRRLLDNHLEELGLLIKAMGGKTIAISRFLDRISQDNIQLFLQRIAPDKVLLLNWISQTYLSVEETYKQINQTNIRILRSINEITFEIYTQENLNSFSNEAFMEKHFERMALKHNIRLEVLLGSIFKVVQDQARARIYNIPFSISILERIYEKKVGVEFGHLDNAEPLTKAEVEASWKKKANRNFILPTDVLKELLVLKKSGILGKHHVKLHRLLQDQMQWRKEAKDRGENLQDEDILVNLSEQLALDPVFFEQSILLSKSLISSSVPILYTLIKSPSKDHKSDLLDHLIDFREEYQIQELRSLLDKFINQNKLTSKKFEQIVQILFNDRGSQILKALEQWFKVNALYLNRSTVINLQHRFIQLSLQFVDPKRNLSRIFSNLQETIEPSIQKYLQVPDDVKYVMSDQALLSFEQQLTKKRSPVFIKEKQLLAFYSIIDLESELEGIVNDTFFKNILYSFDLLRGRYRSVFVEILRKYSIAPEFAQFFMEEGNQALWRAIISVMPESVTRKTNEYSKIVDHLFNLLSLSAASKEMLPKFIISNTRSFYFSEPEEMPDGYTFFLHFISQAEKAGLLSNQQRLDLIRNVSPDWPTFLRKIKGDRVQFKNNQARIRPDVFLKIIKETRTWPTEQPIHTSTSTLSEINLQGSWNILQYVLNNYAFPAGHPFDQEDIKTNTLYFRSLFKQHPGLLFRVLTSVRTPRQKSLFFSWLDDSMGISLLASVFNQPENYIRVSIQAWSSYFPTVKESDWSIQLLGFYLNGKKSSTFQKLIIDYLSEQTSIHVLDILTCFHSIDPSADLFSLIPKSTIDWKLLPSFLYIYAADDVNWYKTLLTWSVLLDEYESKVSKKDKALHFIRLIDQHSTNKNKQQFSQSVFEHFSILENISASKAFELFIVLSREGVDIADLMSHFAGYETQDRFPYDQIISLIRSFGQDSRSILKALPTSFNSISINEANVLVKIEKKLQREDQLNLLTRSWLLNPVQDFPFRFVQQGFSITDVIQSLQKNWPSSIVEIYNQWMDIFISYPLHNIVSNAIFFYKTLADSIRKNIISQERVNVILFLEILHKTSAKEKEVVDMLGLLSGKISIELLLNPEVFYWLSTNLKELDSITAFLSNTNNSLYQKWVYKLELSEVNEDSEERISFLNEKLEMVLLYEDEFLYSRIYATQIDTDLQAWINSGSLSYSDEKRIRDRVLQIPFLLLIKEPYMHKQAIRKLSDWISISELNRQFQLILKANIASSDIRVYLQQSYAHFFDHATRGEVHEILYYMNGLIQHNKRWNKASFWQDLQQNIAHLAAMEKAIVQYSFGASKWRKAGSIKPILDWHVVQNQKNSISPLKVLEYYLMGDSVYYQNRYLTLAETKKLVKQAWNANEKNFPFLMFALSNQEVYRKRIVELMDEYGEHRLMEKIHPRLWHDWNLLEKIFTDQFNISIRQNLGLKNVKDIWDLFLYNWAVTGYKITHPMLLLREVILMLIPKLDSTQLQAIHNFDTKVLNYPEKDTWKRLLSVVPDLKLEKMDKPKPWNQTVESELDLPDEEDAIEGVTIQNAGLILLWPYLNRFFKFLKLLDGNDFVDQAALERAIQLTQYLVNFQTEIDEQGLMLNKLLCGADFKFPVANSFEPTPEESSLARKMLQGAVQNWEQMKNTRPETFQETFLQREGRLYRLEDRWELVVEKKAYDMLLDTIPWNISMIHLSWMSDRLIVIWRGK